MKLYEKMAKDAVDSDELVFLKDAYIEGFKAAREMAIVNCSAWEKVLFELYRLGEEEV